VSGLDWTGAPRLDEWLICEQVESSGAAAAVPAVEEDCVFVLRYGTAELSTIKPIQAEALAWIVRFLRASAWIVGANKLRS
jgi:hypothetical protein